MSAIVALPMHAVRRALIEAIVTVLAALATLACTLLIDAEPGPGVLAVVLCLSLSRSHLDRDRRGRIEAAIALPLVGLVAIGVGTLLHRLPWLGAAVFVTGLFLSIWLRRFGAQARRAGSLIALPFVAILVTPYIPATHPGLVPAWSMPVVVALLALLWVTALHTLAERLGWLAVVPPPAPPTPVAAVPATATPSTARGSAWHPIASTRLAIQMAVALSAAFLLGFTLFPTHWAWVVLTAFIVGSGNRGRGDVVYKSVLRVGGAALGSVVAWLLDAHLGGHDATTVALILTAIFFGLWLRPLGYAWWALFVTLALALLQGFQGGSAGAILWPRLLEIVIGAVIGIAAAWFVLPIRSVDVLRRRLADTLALLADALDPATPPRPATEIEASLHALGEIRPAFAAGRRARALLPRRWQHHAQWPADSIDILLACGEYACALIASGASPVEVRRAIGTARKALREPAQILPTLQALRVEIAAAATPVAAAVAPPQADAASGALRP